MTFFRSSTFTQVKRHLEICFYSLGENRPRVQDMLEKGLEDKRAIKWYVVSKIQFSRDNDDWDKEYISPFFRSAVITELNDSMLPDHIDRAFEKIKSSFDEFIKRESGWILGEIIHLEVKMVTYQPPAAIFLFPASWLLSKQY